MNSFYINLNEQGSKKPRVRRLLTLGAITCLVFILSSLSIFLTLGSSLEWFFLAAALYLALYVYYAWITFKANLFVKADSSGIEFKFGIRSSSNLIIWDSIKKVRIGPTYISFFKKSGRRKRIQLSWLPYSKVIEIKEKLLEMCEYKRIEYEKVDFIKYTKKKGKKER